MKSITIGFSKPQVFKFYAWLIMKCDRATFDHAYLKFHSDSLDRDIIYQAVGKGVQFIGKLQFEKHSKAIEEYRLNIEENNYTTMMRFCVDNAGISYGFKEVLGLALVKLCAKFGKHIANPFNQGAKEEFCSEIVSRCLNEAKPDEFNIDAENISPKELNTLLKQLNVEQVL